MFFFNYMIQYPYLQEEEMPPEAKMRMRNVGRYLYFLAHLSLQYKKTANSVVLSLFMRTNGKCNNSHAP